MNKNELMLLVIKQLLEQVDVCPECFDLECDEVSQHKTYSGTTIVWRPRIESDGEIMNDPISGVTNTIILYYNKSIHTLSCHIFLKDIGSLPTMNMQSDASMEIAMWWPKEFYKPYRKFNKLKKALIQHHKRKENNKFFSKLMSVFPTSLDDKLLK